MREGIELDSDDPAHWLITCDQENFQRFRDIIAAAAELKNDDDCVSMMTVETIQISQKSDARPSIWAPLGCLLVMALGVGVWVIGLITVIGWFRN